MGSVGRVGIDELLHRLVIQLFIGGWVLGGMEGMTNSFLGWWGVLGGGIDELLPRLVIQ